MLELENKLFHEDNLLTLGRMPDDYLDLTITSPPYNVDLGNNKYNKNSYDLYKDNKDHREYLCWLKTVFEQVYKKTTSGGRCVINIGDGQNGRVPTHSDVLQLMVEIGWLPMSTILWEKGETSNRTAWGSFVSPSAPSFPRSFEFILVFSKDNFKLIKKGETDLTNEEFIKWSNATWKMPTAKSSKVKHPAPFPIDLPFRCIKMLSWVNAVVYDPFMGSGSTAIAAKLLNRRFIGSELSKDYFLLSLERLGEDVPEEYGIPRQKTIFDL